MKKHFCQYVTASGLCCGKTAVDRSEYSMRWFCRYHLLRALKSDKRLQTDSAFKEQVVARIRSDPQVHDTFNGER